MKYQSFIMRVLCLILIVGVVLGYNSMQKKDSDTEKDQQIASLTTRVESLEKQQDEILSAIEEAAKAQEEAKKKAEEEAKNKKDSAAKEDADAVDKAAENQADADSEADSSDEAEESAPAMPAAGGRCWRGERWPPPAPTGQAPGVRRTAPPKCPIHDQWIGRNCCCLSWAILSIL